MTIGELIRNKRKEKNMTQQELGKILDVSSQMIAQYENDKRKPKIETLRKICSAMNITIGELGDDVWKYYSPKEFADDLDLSSFGKSFKAAMNNKLAQIEGVLDQSILDVANSIGQGAEAAQRHMHEFVDSDWRCMILLNDYEKLNTIGRSEAIKRVSELREIKKYTESDE